MLNKFVQQFMLINSVQILEFKILLPLNKMSSAEPRLIQSFVDSAQSQ